MKRIITACFIILTFVVGTYAQNQDQYKKLDESAKRQSEELTKVLSLNEDQKTLLWRAIYARDKTHYDNLSNSDVTPTQAKERKSKIDENFKANMMKILSEDQYKNYTKWLSKQKL